MGLIVVPEAALPVVALLRGMLARDREAHRYCRHCSGSGRMTHQRVFGGTESGQVQCRA